MANINFLSDLQRIASEQAKKDHQYLLIAIGMIGVSILAWGGFFSYNSYLDAQASGLNKEKAEKQTALEQYASSQAPYLLFVNKVKVITEIIDTRNNGLKRVEDTGNYINTDGIEMQSVNYKMNEKFFDSGIYSYSTFKSEQLYESLTNEEFRSDYQSIDYGSLSRNSQGHYNTTMKFNL